MTYDPHYGPPHYHQQPGHPPVSSGPQQQYGLAPAPKKKRGKVILAAVGGLLALCCGGTVVAVIAADPDTTPTAGQEPVKPKVTDKTGKALYKTLTAREWLQIAKAPDAHVGETVVVYGSVTQFDAATGKDAFRANVGAKDQQYAFDYPTNTFMSGNGGALAELVQDDEFKANVTVAGSLSYDTQIGGGTTVPQLQVDAITVL